MLCHGFIDVGSTGSKQLPVLLPTAPPRNFTSVPQSCTRVLYKTSDKELLQQRNVVSAAVVQPGEPKHGEATGLRSHCRELHLLSPWRRFLKRGSRNQRVTLSLLRSVGVRHLIPLSPLTFL